MERSQAAGPSSSLRRRPGPNAGTTLGLQTVPKRPRRAIAGAPARPRALSTQRATPLGHRCGPATGQNTIHGPSMLFPQCSRSIDGSGSHNVKVTASGTEALFRAARFPALSAPGVRCPPLRSPAPGTPGTWPPVPWAATATATMGHGCVSVGVRRVSWVLLGRRGHFAMVFTGVKCPCLAGRDGGLGRMPGMPGYPGGIGRRHGSFRIMRRSRPETHSSGNPPMGHRCCSAGPVNRNDGPWMSLAQQRWPIDAVARARRTASMGHRCGPASPGNRIGGTSLRHPGRYGLFVGQAPARGHHPPQLP